MIKTIGEIMLYVNDIEKSMKFWKENLKFKKIEKTSFGTYKIAPNENDDVYFVLQDKNKIAKMNPNFIMNNPSILMQAEHLEEIYDKLLKNGVNVNPITMMGNMKTFNFSDEEENYFAIREI